MAPDVLSVLQQKVPPAEGAAPHFRGRDLPGFRLVPPECIGLCSQERVGRLVQGGRLPVVRLSGHVLPGESARRHQESMDPDAQGKGGLLPYSRFPGRRSLARQRRRRIGTRLGRTTPKCSRPSKASPKAGSSAAFWIFRWKRKPASSPTSTVLSAPPSPSSPAASAWTRTRSAGWWGNRAPETGPIATRARPMGRTMEHKPWHKWNPFLAQVCPLERRWKADGAGMPYSWRRCDFWWGTCAAKRSPARSSGAGPHPFSPPAPSSPNTCSANAGDLRHDTGRRHWEANRVLQCAWFAADVVRAGKNHYLRDWKPGGPP